MEADFNLSREQELAEAIDRSEVAERKVIQTMSALRERNRELARTNEEIIEMLGDVVEMRNEESGMHIQRVKAFSRVLAMRIQELYPEYGLTREDVELITSASALHDVGKIMIPDAILLKPGRLTPEEFAIMKTHSARGCDVLKRAPKSWSTRYLQLGLDICRHHHEKWDGRGYPDGLKGDEIPIAAQIVSVADCFDALTTERVYKPAFSVDKAYEMILGGECGAFSEKMMRCFRDSRELFGELAEHPERADAVVSTSVYGRDKLHGLRVLMVDDNDIVREINREVMEQEGAQVSEACSGIEAIDLVQSGLRPDVILMDIVMPEMDGITATKRIREIEGNAGERMTIISLTAEGSQEQVDECLKAGADDCMSKPLNVTDLTRGLMDIKKRKEQRERRRREETFRNAGMDRQTGVRNITAFASQVAELTGRIAGSVQPEFAVVLCDLVGTKEINDEYGFDQGDQYIRNAAGLLKEVYSNSAIYRIGGDEFLTVLQRRDYQNREVLTRVLKERLKEARELQDIDSGLTDFRLSAAVYDPETDTSVAEVIRRAQAEMDREISKR